MPSRRASAPTPPAAAPDPRQPGARLRALRTARGLTLAQLSRGSGVALSTLSKIELGQVAASYGKFVAVARALQVDLAQLLDDGPAVTPGAGGARAPAAGGLQTPTAGGPQAAATGSATAGGLTPSAVHDRFSQPGPGLDTGAYRYSLLGHGFAGRSMTPMHGLIRARHPSQIAEPSRHAGQEFITVLRGRVRILFEHGAPIDLQRGESAYFDSGVAHCYLSTGRGEAEVLVVMTEG